ncbi:MAG: hypothetical protein R6W67_01410 [Bacteroidales bacterium]
MRTLLILSLVLAVLTYGCKDDGPDETRLLSYGTPYELLPEILNGQVKSMTERQHLVVETDGQLIAGKPMTKADRDSLNVYVDFTIWYNENGVISRIERMIIDSLLSTWVADIENDMITRTTLYVNETPSSYFTFTNNEKGLFLEALRYRSQADTLMGRNVYTHDTSDRLTECLVYSSSGDLMSKFVMEYGENDRMIRHSIYNSENIQTSGYNVEYNEMGFTSKVDYLGREGVHLNTITTDYLKYDDHGNWLEAVRYLNGNPLKIAKRVYEYY